MSVTLPMDAAAVNLNTTLGDGPNLGITSGLAYLQEKGMALGLKLLAAVAIWIVCRWLIKFVVKLVQGGLEKRAIDPTIVKYGCTVLRSLLTVLLVIALLGYFGIDTASFAALLAGIGVAIGMAWSGLLQDFAAGVFMVVLRPFKVGDEVIIGDGTHGIVTEIGLFTTTVDEWVTHHTVITGNGKVFGAKIVNQSANDVRGAEILVQLSGSADASDMIKRFEDGLRAIPGMVNEPAPHVAICDETMAGPVIHVRPVAKREEFWAVYWATHHMIKDTLDSCGYAPPTQGVSVVSHVEKSVA